MGPDLDIVATALYVGIDDLLAQNTGSTRPPRFHLADAVRLVGGGRR